MKAIDIPVGHIAQSKSSYLTVLNIVQAGFNPQTDLCEDIRLSVYLDDGNFRTIKTERLNDDYDDLGLYSEWIR